MKLQINVSGAWRDVAEFADVNLPMIKSSVVDLARALARPSFRIIDTRKTSRSPEVVAYLDAPFLVWRKG